MTDVRAGRPKPGLQLQHLTALNAAAEISKAEVEGAVLGSQEIVFEPGETKSGNFSFNIGSAGSTTLVLQTLLPALAFARGDSTLRVTGGTSNPFAPSSWFVEKAFLPGVEKAGVNAAIEVEQFGYYPKGGGVLHGRVKAVKQINSFKLLERGNLKRLRGYSIVSNLLMGIAERMKTRALKNLSEAGFEARVELVNAPSAGQGAEFFLLAEYENCVNGFSALGEPGKPAEKVAGEAVHAFKDFHSTGACVEAYLADQLLLYAALAQGESAYSVSHVSRHLLTNAWVIKKFLPDCGIEVVTGGEGGKGEVRVSGTRFSRE